jgi:tetratricopeptide (TPR) repeat protein
MADQFYQGQRMARVQVDSIVRSLERLYGKPDRGLAHLEPDLIGEHHVAMVSDIDLIEGCLSWITDEPTEMQEKRRRDLLTVLQRATQPEHGAAANHSAAALLDHVGSRYVKSLASDMVAVMVETPGAMARLLERQIDIFDEEASAAIDKELPLQSVTLMELSLRVAERRADLARKLDGAADTAADLPPDMRENVLNRLASCVGTLGIRLSNLGRREDALAASQEAVDIRRRLAQTRPDAFLPDLATSLNNLGGDLSNLGRREDALAASQEAVDIYRRLAQTRPDAFLPDLAMSLGALSGALTAAERHGDAAAATHEGLMTIAPFLEKHASAFDSLARALVRDYLSACEKAGTERDLALLERVGRAFKK